MKFNITLRSQVPFTALGEMVKSVEVEADDIEEAKRRGHTLIALQNGKAYPIFGVSVTAEKID